MITNSKTPIVKPDITGVDLADLEDLAKEVHSMEDGPDKDKMRSKLQEFTGMILEKKQLPASPIQVEKPLLHAVDYLPGLLRAGAGEATIAAKHLYNHEPQAPDVMQHLKDAANPFDGKMAESGEEINKRLGVQHSDTSLADTAAGQAMGATKGSWYDMGADTAKALPWNMMDPAMLKAGLTKLLSKGTVQGTAKELEAALAKQVADQADTSLGARASRMVKGAVNLAVDPGDSLGTAGIKNRLSNADKATRARGLRDFSDVYMEHGAPGVTSNQIQTGVENAIEDTSKAKRAVLEANPNAPKATLDQVMDPINSPEFNEKAMTYGDTGAYREAQKNVRGDLLETARARRLQQVQNHPVLGPLYDQGLINIDQLPLGGQQLSTMDLERLARSAQDKAAAARVYAKPGAMAVKNLTDLKMIPQNMAEGDLQHGIGMNARDLQSSLLDQANPGAGGQVFQANKDLSSLFTGAPFIDRTFSRAGNASSRSQNWLRGLNEGKLRLAGDAILGAKDVAQMGASKALRSPWTRLGAIPAGRAAWRQDFEERQAQDPWTILQQYLPKESN